MRKKRMKTISWRSVISVALAVLILCGAIAGVTALVKRMNDEKKTIRPIFERGGVNAATGEHEDTDRSLYTVDAFSAKGLEINLDFDALVSYQVFFYDENGGFRYATDVLTKSENFRCPVNGKARIEITPLWGKMEEVDEEKIAWYEQWGYVNQLEIRVDKSQKVAKSDYTKLNLTNEFFTERIGYWFNPSSGVNGEWVGDGNEGVDSYYFENDGTLSLLYIDSYQVNEGENYGLQVCYRDGSVSYFGSTWEKAGSSSKDVIIQDLPTCDNPLYLPKGTMIVIWGAFGDNDPANTIVCLY